MVDSQRLICSLSVSVLHLLCLGVDAIVPTQSSARELTEAEEEVRKAAIRASANTALMLLAGLEKDRDSTPSPFRYEYVYAGNLHIFTEHGHSEMPITTEVV